MFWINPNKISAITCSMLKEDYYVNKITEYGTTICTFYTKKSGEFFEIISQLYKTEEFIGWGAGKFHTFINPTNIGEIRLAKANGESVLVINGNVMLNLAEDAIPNIKLSLNEKLRLLCEKDFCGEPIQTFKLPTQQLDEDE